MPITPSMKQASKEIEALFLVIINKDGNPASVNFGVQVDGLKAIRQATMEDVIRSCRDIADDFQGLKLIAKMQEMIENRKEPCIPAPKEEPK